MKKVLIFFMAISLFTACKNDKNGKTKTDKNSTDTRNKDDYKNDDKSSDEKSSDEKSTDNKDSRDNDNTPSWSKSDEGKFMDDCEGTAKQNVGAARANQYCDCMLQKIKTMYSTYSEADRKLAGSSKDEINKLAEDCNRQ